MLTNESQCFKKRSYWTYTDAYTSAQKCKRKRGVNLRIYTCPYCKQFHLTSSTGK